MAMKHTNEPTGTPSGIMAALNRNMIECPYATTPDSLSELIELVENALAKADALELSMVGIDLCTALERLKELERLVLPLIPPDNR